MQSSKYVTCNQHCLNVQTACPHIAILDMHHEVGCSGPKYRSGTVLRNLYVQKYVRNLFLKKNFCTVKVEPTGWTLLVCRSYSVASMYM